MHYSESTTLEDVSLKEANAKLAASTPELIDMSLVFEPKGNLALNVRGLTIQYDAAEQEFVFTNTARVEGEKAAWKKNGPYRDNGARRISAPTVAGKVTLRALVDRASLELFVNNGQAAGRFVVVPDATNRSIQLEGAEDQTIESIVVNKLKSIWED